MNISEPYAHTNNNNTILRLKHTGFSLCQRCRTFFLHRIVFCASILVSYLKGLYSRWRWLCIDSQLNLHLNMTVTGHASRLKVKLIDMVKWPYSDNSLAWLGSMNIERNWTLHFRPLKITYRHQKHRVGLSSSRIRDVWPKFCFYFLLWIIMDILTSAETCRLLLFFALSLSNVIIGLL